MLDKLGELYPLFSNTVAWEDAHILLADFCVPEELRNQVDMNHPLKDRYYQGLVADRLGIDFVEVYEAFHNYTYGHSSKSQESQPQL